MSIRNTLKVRLFLFIAIIYSISILFLSLANLNEIEVIQLEASDKLYHILSYTVLVMLWLIYFKYKNKHLNFQSKYTTASLVLVFGIIIEIFQLILTNYRSFDWWDILANGIGIFSGMILFLPLEKYLINKNI